MQSNEIALLNKFGITSNGTKIYSEESNSFLGNGYTSMAGNTYFNSVRFLEGIVIKEDVGNGHTHTFVNGIRLYGLKDKTLLCERNYHCCFYSKSFIMGEVISMLTELLLTAATKEKLLINVDQVKLKIESIVKVAFENDQRQVLFNQIHKHLES